MATLNVIGETFHNWEQLSHQAAARDLTLAVADVAPRGFAATLLVANDGDAPTLDHPKAEVEVLPLRASILPIIWHNGNSARPLDGQFVHSLTPLVPLRTRDEDDGSQSTVTIPHMLAWDDPDIFPKHQARAFRSFTRRAIKRADVIIAPTHAVAERLRELYGPHVPVQVMPLAPPAEFLEADDAAERREALGVPERYLLTTAYPGDFGRLEWVLRALETTPELPPLVVVNCGGEFDPSTWGVLKDRVHAVSPRELADLGALIGGAELLVQPQQAGDTGYHVYGALAHGVPVVHSGAESFAELALEGGVAATTERELVDALRRLTDSPDERARLSVHARDRSRNFSWAGTAWQLWEIHANI